MLNHLAIFTFLAAAAASTCDINWAPLTGASDLPTVNKPTPSNETAGPQFPSLFGPFIGFAIPEISKFETPIQFRLIQEANTIIYSTMASFEETPLEHFGRTSVSTARRIGSNCDGKARDHGLVYALLYASKAFFPNIFEPLKGAFTAFGANTGLCNFNIDDNTDCMDPKTPWGNAHLYAIDALKFAAKDGWNADGKLSREYNPRPYEDFRAEDAYLPINTVGSTAHYRNWEPLLESNGRGYLTRQEHVTPHIGETARSIFFQDADICAKETATPPYHNPNVLETEMDNLLLRMKNLNDLKKMEIEFFDSKLTSLVPLLAQLHERLTGTGLDDWRFIQADSVTISALYESVIVSWKEKVAQDFVRPPSYAAVYAQRKGTDQVETWAGPGQGVKTFSVHDWEPYIRTMPHAEYPSGSSCACAVYESSLKKFYGTSTSDGSFSDSAFANLQGPPYLLMGWEQHSSIVEPGVTPAAFTSTTYNSLAEIAEHCGNSRLDGGMHFTDSVPAGRDLCIDIGTKVAERFEQLFAGNVPSYVINVDNMPNVETSRC